MKSLAALLTTLLLLPLPAVAAPPAVPPGQTLGSDAPPAAEARYQSGRALYRAGKFGEAAREFRMAFAIWPKSARLAYNLARSLERSDAPQEAVDTYRQYLALSPDAADRAEIESIIGVLVADLDRTRGTAVVTTTPAGARIAVDHGPLSVTTTPISLPLSPGKHTLHILLDGFDPVERTVEMLAGQSVPIDVQLTATAQALPVASTPAPASTAPPSAQPASTQPAVVESAAPESDPPKWRKPLGYGLLGGAVLAIGAGVYFTMSAGDAADASQKLGPQDDSKRASLDDDLGSAKLGMGVGFGLGAALAGAGVYLLLVPGATAAASQSPDSGGVAMLQASPPAAWQVFPWRNGVGAGVSF